MARPPDTVRALPMGGGVRPHPNPSQPPSAPCAPCNGVRPMTTIMLQQWPIPLTATRGTILDAALAAGVPYPHSCRSGDCGACKSRLFCGEVTMDGCAPEALTATERADGLILACREIGRASCRERV